MSALRWEAHAAFESGRAEGREASSDQVEGLIPRLLSALEAGEALSPEHHR